RGRPPSSTGRAHRLRQHPSPPLRACDRPLRAAGGADRRLCSCGAVAVPDRAPEPDLMRIAIVADACDPPTNGVIRTLRTLTACLEAEGQHVLLVLPPGFLSVPCPSQPDIRLAIAPWPRLRRLIDDFRPEAVHVATEGPL